MQTLDFRIYLYLSALAAIIINLTGCNLEEYENDDNGSKDQYK
jgi:hypothetical protein